MHPSKVIVKDILDKATHTKLFEDQLNQEALAIAQEVVDRFGTYLKYRTVQDSHFLYQLRVNDVKMPLKVKDLILEALEPLGWKVSYTLNSTTIAYDFTIT